MKRAPCTILLSLLLLLTLQQEGHAFTWPKWGGLQKAIPSSGESSAKQKQKRVRIAEFSGGTGGSAQRTLVEELTASREFAITNENADYVVSGSSVGGRVTGHLHDRAGKQIFDRTYAAPGLDENLKALADDLIYAITGSRGLATSRIVFVSDRSGTKQIYTCDSEGRDVQQVTRHKHGAVAPSLAPDSSAIAYTSYRSGFPVVLVLDLGGGWERTITDTPGSSFGAAFSPDGQQLAMVMSFLGNPEIFVTDLNSNTAGCISDTVGVPNSPAWHPDGTRVIFSDDRGQGPRLYITELPAKNGAGARLWRWRTGYHFCTDPEWSPDGNNVAFTAIVGGEPAVIVKAFPSGTAREVQLRGAQHPSWSPNGRYLCYTQHGALYMHDLRNNSRRVILSGFGRISEPRWMR